MKLSEIHRAPGFWGWIRKAAGVAGAVLALWGAYDKVKEKIVRPIQQERAARIAEQKERRSRSQAVAKALDSLLVDMQFVKRRLAGRH